MITLGLDPSLKGFGWCVHNSSAEGPKRVIDRGRLTTNSKDVFVSRYMYLRHMIGDLLDRFPQIEAVGVESPTFGATWSSGAYGLFLYVNEAIYLRRKDVVYFDPLRLKFLTKEDPTVRQGKMFKSDMVNAAKADTGITGKFPHDEADAYLVARFAARFWEFVDGVISEDDLLPTELHVFTEKHTYVKGKKAGRTEHRGVQFKEGDRFYRFSKLSKVKQNEPQSTPRR